MSSHPPSPPEATRGEGGAPPDAGRGSGEANGLGRTRRARLRELLLSTEEGLTLEAIEKILEAKRQTVLADLEHLRLSFRHQDATLFVLPPTCGICGFTFRLQAPKAPSRCPQCKGRDLSQPVFKASLSEG